MSTIDWDSVIKIAGGGYGITFLILIILALATWVVGLILQRIAKGKKGGGTEKGEA